MTSLSASSDELSRDPGDPGDLLGDVTSAWRMTSFLACLRWQLPASSPVAGLLRDALSLGTTLVADAQLNCAGVDLPVYEIQHFLYYLPQIRAGPPSSTWLLGARVHNANDITIGSAVL